MRSRAARPSVAGVIDAPAPPRHPAAGATRGRFAALRDFGRAAFDLVVPVTCPLCDVVRAATPGRFTPPCDCVDAFAEAGTGWCRACGAATGPHTGLTDDCTHCRREASFPFRGVVSLGLSEDGNVQDVTGDTVRSWAVRRDGNQRYLDVRLNPTAKRTQFEVTFQQTWETLPERLAIAHVQKGEAVGFDLLLNLRIDDDIRLTPIPSEDFQRMAGPGAESTRTAGFRSPTGGRLEFRLDPSGTEPRSVQWSKVRIDATLAEDGRSVLFRARANADVLQADEQTPAIEGRVAVLAPEGDKTPVVQRTFDDIVDEYNELPNEVSSRDDPQNRDPRNGDRTNRYTLRYDRAGNSTLDWSWIAPVR